jgi:aminoglycoside phosphotransferase (APT) family kinase protein
MTANTQTFAAALERIVLARIAGTTCIEGLQRLSAGATMETWSFVAVGDDRTLPLILRRTPPGNSHPDDFAKLRTEAAVIEAAVAAGVRAPIVRCVLQPKDELGGGFLMDRIQGETIARKIFRSLTDESTRRSLLRQIATTAAQIHRVPRARLPVLKALSVVQALHEQEQEYRKRGQSRPVFELALRYLREHAPTPVSPCLVHGDYRMGNLIVGPQGLMAVLDWELCHLGDPMLDLAWLCLPPWRFGRIEQAAGGIGTRDELFTAYESVTGAPLDRDRVRYWEIFGSLRWGLMCAGMIDWFRSGRDRSVERAMIARRTSESELDLLRYLTENDHAG